MSQNNFTGYVTVEGWSYHCWIVLRAAVDLNTAMMHARAHTHIVDVVFIYFHMCTFMKEKKCKLTFLEFDKNLC